MKTAEIITKTTVYTSDVVPAIQGDTPHEAKVIAWADANPVVWKIVMGTRSKAFGRNATEYMGCQRGESPSSALARAITFKDIVDGDRSAGHDAGDFWTWRARFTLEHYNDKGFKGGFFQQFDGKYDRGCCTLDYTPATRDEVIARFRGWCDSGYKYETAAIKIDKKVILTVKP